MARAGAETSSSHWFLAGALSWAIVYPLNLVKTRVRSLPHDCRKCERGMARVGSDIIRWHGWQGLYHGFGITIASVPSEQDHLPNVQDDVGGAGARVILML